MLPICMKHNIQQLWSKIQFSSDWRFCFMCVYETSHDVIKWKKIPRYWPFVRGIHRSPVNFLHNGQWRGAMMFSLICDCINGWVNNDEAGDLRCSRAHYDVTVMLHLHPKSYEKQAAAVTSMLPIFDSCWRVFISYNTIPRYYTPQNRCFLSHATQMTNDFDSRTRTWIYSELSNSH